MAVNLPTGDARQPSDNPKRAKRGPASAFKRNFEVVLKIYRLIRDCIDGEIAVKARRTTYLPQPNPEDASPENVARYGSYLERAVFYNVTRRTLNGLVGQIFSREPIIEVPDELNVVVEDATGLGVDLTQLSKSASKYVVGFGRSGIFTDYPQTDAPATLADIQSGKIRPYLRVYPPWDVINWRYDVRGGTRILTLVVMREDYVRKDDGFTELIGNQWRVLWLNDGVYQMDIYRDITPSWVFETHTPVDSDGNTFDTLPFEFMGSENNDPDIDDAPLYDLASLNIAHYRNSADYEEACYIVGQPTPYFTGLTENWVKEILKGKVQLGARAAVPLPAGATAGLIQVQANSMPYEAMQQKERQMVALGAKIVEQTKVQRTATEAALERSDETSILSTSADNVSAAFVAALKFAARFVGADTTGLKFELNTEFDLIKMLPAERQQLLAEWVSSAISWTEMRENMRRGGVARQTDDEAKADIVANPPPALLVPGIPAIKPATPPADPSNPAPSTP